MGQDFRIFQIIDQFYLLLRIPHSFEISKLGFWPKSLQVCGKKLSKSCFQTWAGEMRCFKFLICLSIALANSATKFQAIDRRNWLKLRQDQPLWSAYTRTNTVQKEDVKPGCDNSLFEQEKLPHRLMQSILNPSTPYRNVCVFRSRGIEWTKEYSNGILWTV